MNESPRGRRELMLHELLHRIQPQLGLLVQASAGEHLDAVDGRYWMRLEWRALARALRESGARRVQAVGEALAFRRARHMRYPSGVESERAQEITEGLAAYTGVVVAADSAVNATASAVGLLTTAETQGSFVRTFATSLDTAGLDTPAGRAVATIAMLASLLTITVRGWRAANRMEREQ